MAKHIYGWLNTFIPIMEIGGIRKATDQFQSTFCDHRSYSNAALSTQCWLNPSKDEKWDLGGGLLTQETGQETPWQMNSVATKGNAIIAGCTACSRILLTCSEPVGFLALLANVILRSL